MGALFDSPKMPKIPPPPPPPPPPIAPTIDDAKVRAMGMDEANMRKGRAANILTSAKGDLARPTTASKTLLGG